MSGASLDRRPQSVYRGHLAWRGWRSDSVPAMARLKEALLATILRMEEWTKQPGPVWLVPLRWIATGAVVIAALALNLLALLRWPLVVLLRAVRTPTQHHGRPVVANTEAELAALRSSKTLVVVDFFAQWCGPCLLMRPALDELAQRRADQLVVAKVDCSFGMPSAHKDIRGLPTIVVFRGDEELARHEGALSFAQLDALVERCLSDGPIVVEDGKATAVCDPSTGICTIAPPETRTG